MASPLNQQPSSPAAGELRPRSRREGRWSLGAGRTVNVLLACLLVLNLFDAVFTLGWITLGVTTEENPLMDAALDLHPMAFMAVKLGLVGLAVLVIQRWRRVRGVPLATFLLVGLYYWIALNHAWFYGEVLIPAVFFRPLV